MKKVGKKKLGIILTTIGCIILGSLCISLAVKLDRTSGNTLIGSESFTSAVISVDGELNKSDNSAICLSSNKKVDGLTINIKENADLDYTLFFYDKSGDLIISVNKEIFESDEYSIPETADTFNIMIKVAEDDDITIFEKVEYLKGIEVSIAK